MYFFLIDTFDRNHDFFPNKYTAVIIIKYDALILSFHFAY